MPTYLPVWFMGDRCWLQLYGIVGIPSYPPTDDMFGLSRRIGSSYI